MTTLRTRLERLEEGTGAHACFCSCMVFRYPHGQVEQHPVSPLCPHGRDWALVRVYDLSHGDETDGDWI